MAEVEELGKEREGRKSLKYCRFLRVKCAVRDTEKTKMS